MINLEELSETMQRYVRNYLQPYGVSLYDTLYTPLYTTKEGWHAEEVALTLDEIISGEIFFLTREECEEYCDEMG